MVSNNVIFIAIKLKSRLNVLTSMLIEYTKFEVLQLPEQKERKKEGREGGREEGKKEKMT